MNDYIKREDAKQLFLNHMGFEFPQSIKEQIVEKAFEELPPSADVAEVIRCKDCMWGNNKTRSGKRYCELSDMYQVDDGFCNWGEKIK